MDVGSLHGRTALVTGAGSGIGRATALAIGRRGADLIVCDIDATGLAETAAALRALGGEVVAERVDVADREAMRAFAESVHARIEAVDLLVNNAGVAVAGGALHTTLDDWNWIMGVNVWGVVHGCHFFVPPMVRRGRGGHVVNVASAAGFVASEALVAYCMTKYAVLGFSEALRDELAKHRIGVTAVCPGIIDTPITRSARLRGPEATPAARQYLIDSYARRAYTAEQVAENLLRAVARNRGVAPISPEAWLMYYLKRASPGIVAWINRKMSERTRREIARLGADAAGRGQGGAP